MKKQRKQQDAEALAEIRLTELRAVALAVARVFGEKPPKPAVVLGAVEINKAVGADLLETVLQSGMELARKLDAKADGADAVACAEVLLADDQGEAHMESCLREARLLFGNAATIEDAVDLYYELYGEEE